MPLDPQGTLYSQVWTLLEGYAPFTSLVKAGSRYKTSRPREAERQANQNFPAAYPAVYIGTPDKSNRIGYQPFNDSPQAVTLGVLMALNMDIEVVYDATASTEQTPVEAAIEGALHTLGRTLGLSWVTNSTLSTLSRRNEVIGGTNRIITRMRLAVNARPIRNLLTAI